MEPENRASGYRFIPGRHRRENGEYAGQPRHPPVLACKIVLSWGKPNKHPRPPKQLPERPGVGQCRNLYRWLKRFQQTNLLAL